MKKSPALRSIAKSTRGMVQLGECSGRFATVCRSILVRSPENVDKAGLVLSTLTMSDKDVVGMVVPMDETAFMGHREKTSHGVDNSTYRFALRVILFRLYVPRANIGQPKRTFKLFGEKRDLSRLPEPCAASYR